MPNGSEDLSLTVGFDVDEGDLERALQAQIQELSAEFDSVQSAASALVSEMRSLVAPMRDLRDMAKDMASAFKDAKDAAHSIQQDVSSTRLHLGGPPAAGGGAPSGGGGGGLGIIGQLLGGLGGGGGGLLSLLGGGGLLAAGGGLAAGLGALVFGGSGIRNVGTAWNAISRGESPFQAVQADRMRMEDMLSRGGYFAPIQAIAQGYSPLDVIQRSRGEQLAGAYGGIRGMFSGLGQGPVGMISQVAGGAFGAAGGFNVGQELAGQMGLSGMAATGMGMAGAEAGRQLVSGMTERYINEAMQRYPGFLQSMAAIAQPRLYGATTQSMAGLRPGAWGYGPGEWGGALGGLYQGFGGGELSRETVQTAMAYSRLYGVSMGATGQAIGGLLNIGGGGQFATTENREHTMLRVMTDAVAAGFGRRLPEFSQAISGSLGVVLSGPSVIRQDAMQNLIGSVSQATASLARSRGIGLAGAGRMLAPYLGAPGGALRNFMGGGGDPYSTALMWQTNRQAFGNDPYEMMRGLAAAQEDPLGQGLQYLLPSIQTILRQSPTNFGAAAGLQQFFSGMGQDVSFQNIDDLIRNRESLLGQGGADPQEVLRELLGIEDTQQDEGEQLRETMRDIQESGEEIMRDQLGALRASAGWQWRQLGISARMADDARHFHDAQLSETEAMVDLLRFSSLGEAIRSLATLRTTSAQELGVTGDVTGYIRRMGQGIFQQIGTWGAPPGMPQAGGRGTERVRGRMEQAQSVVEELEQQYGQLAPRGPEMTAEQAARLIGTDPGTIRAAIQQQRQGFLQREAQSGQTVWRIGGSGEGRNRPSDRTSPGHNR